MNKRPSLIALLLLLSTSAVADKLQLGGLGGEDEFPPVDEVFSPQVFPVDGDTIEVGLQIIPGFYIYKEKLAVRSLNDEVRIGRWELPEGTMKNDEYFGDMEVYVDGFLSKLAVDRDSPDALELEIEFSYQGCAEGGLCYLPQSRVITVSLPETSKKELPCPE